MEEMGTHSSIFAWKIPWTEKPGGLQSMGSKESDMTEYTCKYMHSDSVGANTDSLDSKHLHELS